MLESYWVFRSSERTNNFRLPRQFVYPLEYPIAIKMDDGTLFHYPPDTIGYTFVTVKNLRYPFLLICFWNSDWGKYLYPTTLMLKEIISIIGEESVPAFWRWHNQVISKHLELLAQGKIYATGVNEVNYDICKKIHFDWDAYYYYKLLTFYCCSVFWKGEYSTKKKKEEYRKYRAALNIFLRNGQTPSEPINVEQSQEKWLSRITEYLRAKSVLDHYRQKLKAKSENLDIKDLISLRDQEQLSFYDSVEKAKQEKDNSIRPNAICKFCGTFIEQVTRFPGSCGSEKCKRLYNAIRKAKQRGTTPSVDIQHLVSKRGKGLQCPVCKQRKKLLYTDRFLCKKCFLNSAEN